jgi:uncharacterized protein YabN with tetrapyrrole methylase and pyrophosphatase domain
MEREAREAGKNLDDYSLEEMDAMWEKAKLTPAAPPRSDRDR